MDDSEMETEASPMAPPSPTRKGDDPTNFLPPPTPSIENEDPPKPPPRSMITKMELQNFKSYAGIKTIGPFHKNFSSVVGPNGSGKSNVIDAMMFVFGKRAKKLRLNKVSELIHNSSSFQNLTEARVSVFFEDIIDIDDERYEIVPSTEIVVTRVARRDNTSSYKLNGKTVPFRKIVEFLNSKGIDLDNNRFLILQGEVEMISMMPPKGKTEADSDGLLEYLEEIIGSNKFVDETKVAEECVESLTDQRQERLNRVKAVEKEKDSLEGAKLEAEALLSKEREIRRKKNVYYQMNILDVTEDYTKITGQKEVLQENIKEESVKLKSCLEEINNIEANFESQTMEYNALYETLKQTKREFATYERREIKLKEDIKHSKEKVKKLSSKIQTETGKEKEAELKAQEAEESIPQLETQVVDLTEKKQEEDSKLDEIHEKNKGKTKDLRIQLQQKTQELSPVEQERVTFQAELDTAVTEVKLLEDSTTRAKTQLVAAEKELANLSTTQSKKREELVRLEDELESSRGRIQDARKEDESLADCEKKLAKRNAELLAKVEEAKSATQFTSNHSKTLRAILAASRNGGELADAGVLGRLGDLATINPKYDIAVSTAVGQLDFIVTKTTAGAQRCLEFLRKHNIGRANFMPLEKMKKGAHDRKVETPENAPRLFDLITPLKFEVSPALFQAVGNTLVAPDMEVATRWAYEYGRRWRVVTIDGKLIEASGTMSGGGKQVHKGRMRLSKGNKSAGAVVSEAENISDADCKKLQVEGKKVMEELKECRQKRRSLQDEIRFLEKRIKGITVKLPKLTMEIESCDTTRENLTKRIPELCAQSKLSNEDKDKVKSLNKKVSKIKGDMAACTLLAAKLESEKAAIQKGIVDVGGAELKKQQAKCKNILSNLNGANTELNTSKVNLTSSQKAGKKAISARATAEKEVSGAEKALETTQEKLSELQSQALIVKEAYDKAIEAEEEKRVSLKEIEVSREQHKKDESKAKCVQVELLAQMDNYQKNSRDLKNQIRHWQSEIRKLLKAENVADDDFDVSDDEMEEDEVDKNDDAMQVEQQEGEETSKTNKSDKEASETSLPTFAPNALIQYNLEDVKSSIAMLERERETLAKNANMAAIEEYRKKESDYLTRVSELDEITTHRNEARKKFEELRRLRLEMFMSGFGIITLRLKEMYQMITLGGDAELELVDSLDPFSEGIVFSVRPPKKSWKNIANLSGGEKTLSSLALVFALHHYKPTPLYVMDEIDAALDFKNVSIVANYIKERTKNAQFIIISLRNNMFELADRLVGIYKTNNCTKSVTINPKAFEKKRLADEKKLTGTPGKNGTGFLNNQSNKTEDIHPPVPPSSMSAA